MHTTPGLRSFALGVALGAALARAKPPFYYLKWIVTQFKRRVLGYTWAQLCGERGAQVGASKKRTASLMPVLTSDDTADGSASVVTAATTAVAAAPPPSSTTELEALATTELEALGGSDRQTIHLEGDHDDDSGDSNEDSEDDEDGGLACDELVALGSGGGAPLTCVVRRVSSSLGPSLPLAHCADRRSLARSPAHRSLVVHLSSFGCGSPAASFTSLL